MNGFLRHSLDECPLFCGIFIMNHVEHGCGHQRQRLLLKSTATSSSTEQNPHNSYVFDVSTSPSRLS